MRDPKRLTFRNHLEAALRHPGKPWFRLAAGVRMSFHQLTAPLPANSPIQKLSVQVSALVTDPADGNARQSTKSVANHGITK